MDFKTTVIENLKKRFVRLRGDFEYDDEMSSTQAIYYFKNLDNNLIDSMTKETVNMYVKADGNELKSNMKALKSSSAMTYNLIGNDSIRVKTNAFQPDLYSVTYEKKLDTIKNNSRKANLDVFLKGKNELIFCEMKMTEWLFNNHKKLGKSYLIKGNYYYENSYQAFIKCIEEIGVCKEAKDVLESKDKDEVKCKFQRYDAFQMLKHIMAIYNYARQNSKKIPSKITLVNCVWHLPDSEILPEPYMSKYREKEKLEKEEFKEFYKSTESVRKLFDDINIKFDIKSMDAKEFISNFEKTPEQLDYLMRYCDFSK